MKKLMLLLVACLGAFGLLAPAASAAPGNTPHPTPAASATARAVDGLLRACKNNGWQALFTPIPIGTVAPVDDPATPAVNEANATAYVFNSRQQCKDTVNAGLPVGLLAAAPAGLITVLAPAAFPGAAPPATVTPPALATATVATAGNATTPFALTVNASALGNNKPLTVVVTYRDGHSQAFAGTSSATGTFTFGLGGSCSAALVPANVTIVVTPAGPAASVAIPTTVCPGV